MSVEPGYLCIPRNCAALFPIPTFTYLWAIYIFPGSVCLFGCRKIGRPILGIYKSLIHEFGNWEIEHFISVLEITRPHSFISGNTLLWNQTFILASHRLFICSVQRCAVMWWCCVFGPVMSLLQLYTLHNAQPSPKERQYLYSPPKPPQPKGFLQQFPCMKTREEGRGVVPLPAR